MRRHMDEEYRFSAPGRVEIGGNHTDHQHGCVLAGGVNLDVIAVVAPNNDGKTYGILGCTRRRRTPPRR